MSPLAVLRRVARFPFQMAKPTGVHRRTTAVEQPAPVVLLRPAEAMVNDLAWCPAEKRERLHAFLATGGRVCWTCRTITMDPTPPGGAE